MVEYSNGEEAMKVSTINEGIDSFNCRLGMEIWKTVQEEEGV
jgi:hypothetical protein